MTILYISHETSKTTILGSSLSLANLISSINRECNIIVITPNKGKTYQYLLDKGYRCISVPFKKATIDNRNKVRNCIIFIPKLLVYLISNLYCMVLLAFLLRNEKIDIVHSNSSVIDFGYYLAKVLRVKHIWHIREFQDEDFHLKPFFGWKYLMNLIKKSSFSIAITEPIAKHWHILGLRNSIVLGDAVRKNKDCCMVWPKDKYFLFCGHICKEKGADIAVKAFSCFCKKTQNDYKLVFIGEVEESYKESLLRIDTSINDRLLFLGFKFEVASYFKMATAFLMCSECEGLGRVTIEAMFYGCPVIGRNTGGTSTLIKDEVTGLLFNSVNECSLLMDRISQNTDLAQNIVYNAQTYAKEHFSEEVYGRKILDIYNQV